MYVYRGFIWFGICLGICKLVILLIFINYDEFVKYWFGLYIVLLGFFWGGVGGGGLYFKVYFKGSDRNNILFIYYLVEGKC